MENRKRQGVVLLEMVIALSILALMAGAAGPMILQASEVMASLTQKVRLMEDGLFSEEYMADKVRHSLVRTKTDGAYIETVHPFYAYNQDGLRKSYAFSRESRAWYLLLYDGKGRQPITGDSGNAPAYAVEAGSRPYFMVQPGGLLQLSYRMEHESGAAFAVETAVLPLYDYFLVGEPYE